MTRDSIVWWLAILGALVTYLSTSEPPTAWSYQDWIQFIAAVIATVSGKLATSPLPGEHDRGFFRG